MKMSDDDRVFVPSYPYAASPARGVLSPFEPGTRTLAAGYRIDPRFRPIPTDIVLDKDVAVQLRDGVTIYVDIFRPVGAETVPVIIAWSPYGKSEGTAPSVTGIFDLVGLDNGIVSGLEKFEGPDPAYWCAQGYAICNTDARGVGDSGSSTSCASSLLTASSQTGTPGHLPPERRSCAAYPARSSTSPRACPTPSPTAPTARSPCSSSLRWLAVTRTTLPSSALCWATATATRTPPRLSSSRRRTGPNSSPRCGPASRPSHDSVLGTIPTAPRIEMNGATRRMTREPVKC